MRWRRISPRILTRDDQLDNDLQATYIEASEWLGYHEDQADRCRRTMNACSAGSRTLFPPHPDEGPPTLHAV